jgi:hypothetical protein
MGGTDDKISPTWVADHDAIQVAGNAEANNK